MVTIAGGVPESASFRVARTGTASGRAGFYKRIAAVSLAVLSAISVPSVMAQSAEAPGWGRTPFPPRSLVADAAANELIALHHKDSYLRYRMETVNEKGTQVRDVIESKDGTVARLILKDGKPLTPDQDKAEQQRLNDIIASPAAYAKHVKNSESEKKMADTLVPLMADAMMQHLHAGSASIRQKRRGAGDCSRLQAESEVGSSEYGGSGADGAGRKGLDRCEDALCGPHGRNNCSRSELWLGDAGPHLSRRQGGFEPDQCWRRPLDLYGFFHAAQRARADG